MDGVHWTGGVILGTMLFAHWSYFIAGAISLFFLNDQTKISSLNDLTENYRRFSTWDTRPVVAALGNEGNSSEDLEEEENIEKV